MPKKPGTNLKGEFAFFNTRYEEGSQRSNRRVPNELLGGVMRQTRRERYRRIADPVMDPLTRERINKLIEDLKAEKAKHHPKPE